MAQDLVTAAASTAEQTALRLLSSPALRRWRRAPVNTITFGQGATQVFLGEGWSLTAEDSAELNTLANALELAITPTQDDIRQAKAEIAAMLLVYPQRRTASDAEASAAGRAAAGAYGAAISDLPLWAVQRAIRAWHRGECGDHDYAFAPKPAVLRRVALGMVDVLRNEANHLRLVLSAKPLGSLVPADERAAVASGLRTLADHLGARSDDLRREASALVSARAQAARDRVDSVLKRA